MLYIALYNESASLGTLKWRYATGGIVFSKPAIGSDGTVYFGSHDYYLYAITATGKVTHNLYKI